MSDIIIVIKEEAPDIVITTMEQIPNVEVTSSGGTTPVEGLYDKHEYVLLNIT